MLEFEMIRNCNRTLEDVRRVKMAIVLNNVALLKLELFFEKISYRDILGPSCCMVGG